MRRHTHMRIIIGKWNRGLLQKEISESETSSATQKEGKISCSQPEEGELGPKLRDSPLSCF